MIGPRVQFYGEHQPYEWAWGVRSFSDPNVRYDVTVDLGSGVCECKCMHFQCRLRKNVPTVLNACKHVAAVLTEAKRILRGKE